MAYNLGLYDVSFYRQFRNTNGMARRVLGVWVLTFSDYFNCCPFFLNVINYRPPSIRLLVKNLRAVIFIVSVDDHHKINFINYIRMINNHTNYSSFLEPNVISHTMNKVNSETLKLLFYFKYHPKMT